jgi:alkanesulfonate monooxygenase SsuD/methylene tetrahydromethanopterin reductase-like flavin-dependent oxidoreductase (luciferase family)
VSLRIPTYVAETAAQARNEPEASTRRGIEYAATELADSATSPELAERFRQVGRTPYDEVLKDRLMYGTPEGVIDRLNMYKNLLGISGVVLETNYGGQIPADKLNKSLQLIADKVMPAFR